jgi:hypothetical protein
LAGLDWSGHRKTDCYSDSKLFVTTLAAAVARKWHFGLDSAIEMANAYPRTPLSAEGLPIPAR